MGLATIPRSSPLLKFMPTREYEAINCRLIAVSKKGILRAAMVLEKSSSNMSNSFRNKFFSIYMVLYIMQLSRCFGSGLRLFLRWLTNVCILSLNAALSRH